ncbi:MAG: hypothetical protein QM723_28545 [Myxococcaceae bacterium]
MTEAAALVPHAVVDAIARCAQVLDEPDRLKAEVQTLREFDGDAATFAVALFELERARRGDPEARQAIGAVAQSLLAFWQDKRGDEIATSHPALETLWADASALMVSFEVKRFDQVLKTCWEVRAEAEPLSEAIEQLKPDGNRRVEFAKCLYHLELARLGRTASRGEFARRAGLLQEAYPEPKVAQELIGDDDGLAHLWKELVPYLDEFFEMLEEQQAKVAAAAAAQARGPEPVSTPGAPMPESTAPAPPPPARQELSTEPVRVPDADATPPPAPSPDKALRIDESQESVAVHRAPVPDTTVVEPAPPAAKTAEAEKADAPADAAEDVEVFDPSAPTPPPPPPRPSKADELLKAHLESTDDQYQTFQESTDDQWTVRNARSVVMPPSPAEDERITEKPLPAVKVPPNRDNTATDQVPAHQPAAATLPEEGLNDTLPPQRQMGNVSGVFDLWLTTQAESADVEIIEPGPSVPPPPPEQPEALEMADVIETIPPPPPDTTPVPKPRGKLSSSGIIDLQQAVRDSKAQALGDDVDTGPEPLYSPDEASLAFWRFSEKALELLPPGDGPRAEARVLSGEGRAERKKLNGYADEVLRRFESVPEARSFACLLKLYMAAQMKEKSLFGGANVKRKEAFRAALQLLSPSPLAAGHCAVWFELDGKQTVDLLQVGLEQVSDFLQFCARSGLDPLDPTSAEQFLP